MKQLPKLTNDLIKSCLKSNFVLDDDYRDHIEYLHDECFFYEECTGECDCATLLIYDFGINMSHIKKSHIKELFAAFIGSFAPTRGLLTFSDSKRSNVIYPYMDYLKQYGFKIIEYPTGDGKSIIKRAFYINK